MSSRRFAAKDVTKRVVMPDGVRVISPPAGLPLTASIQKLLDGMVVQMTQARARVLEQLLVESLRAGRGIWVCGVDQQGLDERIPTGEIWDITAIGSIDNLRYYKMPPA